MYSNFWQYDQRLPIQRNAHIHTFIDYPFLPKKFLFPRNTNNMSHYTEFSFIIREHLTIKTNISVDYNQTVFDSNDYHAIPIHRKQNCRA